MNVLLLNLPSFGPRKYCREIMGGFGLEVGDSLLYPPLPLAWQAAIFERAGVLVNLVDGEALELDAPALFERVERAAPRLVGVISSVVTLDSDLAFVDQLKDRFPHVLVYLTGPVIHLYAERILTRSTCDFTIDSQNDDKPLELLRAIEAGGVADLTGISWRDGEAFHTNPPDPQVIDVATLPQPARHFLPNSRYHIAGMPGPITTVQTGRGCPFRCDLCAYEFSQGSHYRTRPIADVMAELDEIVNVHGIRHIVFRDITFTVNRARMLELADAIIAARLGITFWAETTLNLVDEELLMRLAWAGLDAMSFGVETGGADQQAAHWQKKLPSFEETKHVFDTCRKLGIKTRAYFVVGAPGDTPESLRKTREWARALRPTTLQFLPYRELPADPATYQVVDPHTLRAIKKSYLSYYLTPANLAHQLVEPRLFANRVRRFLGLRAS
jgi:radical SAM superfamily enzyme YgiQ (UPF0313 family)